jgi:hypothetical protein
VSGLSLFPDSIKPKTGQIIAPTPFPAPLAGDIVVENQPNNISSSAGSGITLTQTQAHLRQTIYLTRNHSSGGQPSPHPQVHFLIRNPGRVK